MFLIGCESRQQRSARIYQTQLNQIETARLAGDISAAEYLKMKLDAQNQHENRLLPRSSSTTINNYQAPTNSYKPPVSKGLPLNYGGIPAFKNTFF